VRTHGGLNHGGRQLDGAPSSIEAAARDRRYVGGKMEIMFDSGIRRART